MDESLAHGDDADAARTEGVAPAPAPADPALVGFLASRDVACPKCGYNLRGVESARCPECGERLELGLAPAKRFGGWGAFLLLVFAWLFLAGGMNTARQARTLLERRAQQVQAASQSQRFRAQLQAQITRLKKDTGADPFGGLVDDRFPGMEAMREFQAQAD